MKLEFDLLFMSSHRMWLDGWCSLEVKLISLKAVCWLLIEEVIVFLCMTQVTVLWYRCLFEPGSSTAGCVCLTVDGWILILLCLCGRASGSHVFYFYPWQYWSTPEPGETHSVLLRDPLVGAVYEKQRGLLIKYTAVDISWA